MNSQQLKKKRVQYKVTALVDLFYTTGAVKIEKVAELGKLADTKQSLLNEFPFAYNFKISTNIVEVSQ
jgi:hypothetical protein|tara:strand:+ start:29 stop:232 length:204 start_codon:yes stop_codon:yes gene_type:complete